MHLTEEEQLKRVPIGAYRPMHEAIARLLMDGDNEWTTWTDAHILTSAAAKALAEAGWRVVIG